jgi:hypothetical protein
MNDRGWLIALLAGFSLLIAWVSISLLSPGAKLRRRRRKNHSRIESTSNRPAVRFSVRPRRK